MQSFIVGGYVRDKLLGLEPVDRDWVVVGETPESMIGAGYQMVGKDFPVFLHPESREVYSLARTGRGRGYSHIGRTVFAEQDVTLEQDLQRRDLTINAMAMTPEGDLIDPFGGSRDLKNKILRHVGSAFKEDPVRVLRIARFAARFQFSIADETVIFIRRMAVDGELQSMVPERVWAELEKALSEKNTDIFIKTLKDLEALEKVFPELDCLFGIPQTKKYHPEIDAGIHLLLALKVSAGLSGDPLVKFGILVHDLGKCLTDKAVLPRHIGHEQAGVKIIEHFCNRLAIPTKYLRFGRICSKYHLHIHRALELKPKTLVKLFDQIGAFNHPDQLLRFLLVCQADALGRKGLENQFYRQKPYVEEVFNAVMQVSTEQLVREGLAGKLFGEKLKRQRIAAAREKIQRIRENHHG